uniref:Uncharacterized protein n=1 Tax=Ditylenchus dipsaci TaxID=166011 RepID=A0A915DX38_9BILA
MEGVMDAIERVFLTKGGIPYPVSGQGCSSPNLVDAPSTCNQTWLIWSADKAWSNVSLRSDTPKADSKNSYCASGRKNVTSNGRGSIPESNRGRPVHISANSLTIEEEEVELNAKIADHFKLENIGITENPDISDEETFRRLEESMKFENGHYTVGLPWIIPRLELPDNYGRAWGQLNSLLKALQKKPELLQQYHLQINGLLEKEFVEEASRNPAGPKFYMPHHAVIKAEKATKNEDSA